MGRPATAICCAAGNRCKHSGGGGCGQCAEGGAHQDRLVLGATEIRLPERWYNYTVPGVPEFVQDWEGARIPTDKMIEGEVLTQAKVKSDARGSATHQSVHNWQDAPTAVSPQASMRGQQARSARERQDVSTAANPTQLSISTALPHPGATGMLRSDNHRQHSQHQLVAVVVPTSTTQSTQSTQPAGLAPRKWAATQSSISEKGATWQMARTRRHSACTAVQQHSQAAKEQSDSSMQTAGLEAFNLIPQTAGMTLTRSSGDINVQHDAFEPGAVNLHRGGELVQWANEHGMDFVGEIGVPIHAADHVIDLTFSNVVFTSTTVHQDLHCSSDHQSMVTMLSTTPQTQLSDAQIKITDSQLEPFADLIRGLMVDMPCSEGVGNVAQLDDLTQHFTQSLLAAAQAVSKPAQQERTTALWWTADCRRAHRELTTHQTEAAKHQFKDTVRKAKCAYWRQVINEARDADDLEYDPLNDEHWSGMGNLPWNPQIEMEEMERNTIEVQSTSPGTDGITVRMLKACWQHVSLFIQQLYNCCLRLCHFPRAWKLAEVAMIPKSSGPAGGDHHSSTSDAMWHTTEVSFVTNTVPSVSGRAAVAKLRISILRWGETNKVAFAPEKLEMIHLTRKRLTWRPHVSTQAKKARAVAQHIQNLRKIRDGPPADALWKAVTTCVVPSLLYGTEVWYSGCTQPARHMGRSGEVSSHLGWHVGTVEKVLTMAARGVLPVFRTTPIATLYRDAGLPSAMVALEEAKMRFTTRLQVVDEKHPLASQIAPPMIT
ncbi:conserved hypothetical protein [Histoplasma mississippiense (nom. inval.)]|uniref:conserved hypothetical protein n=1 Tax=Ajellomyces capsulatus (strain NAm1 / WU24) TaxID=2059318 RepID=UPI000157D2E2|nr:conserved hypothetical protein [Histoplasma mississippiense (nom. inval.)]EDN04458.1 conserved hypothetical protein [Histoplasma mississippiense (nom. inval.)]